MKRDEILEQLRSAAPSLRAGGMASLYLFGSVALDQAGPHSDVDLFFDPDRNARLTLLDLVALKDRLEALVGRPIDMVSRQALSQRLGKRVVAQAVQVF